MLIPLSSAIVFSIYFCFIAVFFILLGRYKNIFNTLSSQVNIIGTSGIVEQPFSKYNRGKIKVNIKDSWQSMVAITNEDKQFVIGDRILIFGLIEEKVIVISDLYF